jgi:sulfonate transport system substrate-binding protein
VVAFARGSIDAWAVWDPYFAIGELRGGGRVLVNANALGKTNSFYIANRDFAAQSPQLVARTIDVLAKTADWAEAHRDQVGRVLADITGVDLAIQTFAAQRSSFAIGKLTDDIVATQQAVAERFFRLGLIPRHIAVREAIWTASQS